jgi:hypothetical protein
MWQRVVSPVHVDNYSEKWLISGIVVVYLVGCLFSQRSPDDNRGMGDIKLITLPRSQISSVTAIILSSPMLANLGRTVDVHVAYGNVLCP